MMLTHKNKALGMRGIFSIYKVALSLSTFALSQLIAAVEVHLCNPISFYPFCFHFPFFQNIRRAPDSSKSLFDVLHQDQPNSSDKIFFSVQDRLFEKSFMILFCTDTPSSSSESLELGFGTPSI